MQVTSIRSPLDHGIQLYNFCQKQTDECTVGSDHIFVLIMLLTLDHVPISFLLL